MSTQKPSIKISDSAQKFPNDAAPDKENAKKPQQSHEPEIGGFENRPEPTRYGDWETGGRCSDF